jgi:hypothetical protein
MPLFAETFGYTPEQFRALRLDDFTLLQRYLEERNRERR